MKKMAWIEASPRRAPLSMGETIMIADWMLPTMPLARMRRSSGTIWGRMAPMAGPWMACPHRAEGHHEGDEGDESVCKNDQFLPVLAVGPDTGEGREEKGRHETRDDGEGHRDP